MSILYIAPFFEKNALAESATYNVKALSGHMNITCRPIGDKLRSNPIVQNFSKHHGKYDYLIIHGEPHNFMWKSGFKKVIGITHLKSPLISETNYHNYFGIVDQCYHDSSFEVEGLTNIKPMIDELEYDEKLCKTSKVFKFLIAGAPFAYEEMLSVTRAYHDEFRQEENVELILKTPEFYNPQTFMENLEGLHSTGRKYNNKAYPNVGLTNKWMEKEELLRFYADFDCILNCSLYNRWSRPVVDCLFLNKRCISLVDEVNGQNKMAFGPSEYKDYPVGVSPTLALPEIKQVLRKAYLGQIKNRLNEQDFVGSSAQRMAIFK